MRSNNKILFIIVIFIINYSCNINCKSYYEDEIKDVLIRGIVINKYINYNNHGNAAIKLKDSTGNIKDYSPFCFYGLYEAVQKNDSLCKPSGSLEYRIYRKDTVIKLYPVIDGDTLR